MVSGDIPGTIDFNMEHHYFDNTTKAGITTGTLLTIFANIRSEDILKTMILAAVGAIASFVVTLLLKIIVRQLKK